jgi:hypothetical protein
MWPPLKSRRIPNRLFNVLHFLYAFLFLLILSFFFFLFHISLHFVLVVQFLFCRTLSLIYIHEAGLLSLAYNGWHCQLLTFSRNKIPVRHHHRINSVLFGMIAWAIFRCFIERRNAQLARKSFKKSLFNS